MFFRCLCTQGPQATPAHPSAQLPHTYLVTRLPVNNKKHGCQCEITCTNYQCIIVIVTAIRLSYFPQNSPQNTQNLLGGGGIMPPDPLQWCSHIQDHFRNYLGTPGLNYKYQTHCATSSFVIVIYSSVNDLTTLPFFLSRFSSTILSSILSHLFIHSSTCQ